MAKKMAHKKETAHHKMKKDGMEHKEMHHEKPMAKVAAKKHHAKGK